MLSSEELVMGRTSAVLEKSSTLWVSTSHIHTAGVHHSKKCFYEGEF